MARQNKVACLFDYHQWSEEMPYWCINCGQFNPKYKHTLWSMSKAVNTCTVKILTHASVHTALHKLERNGKSRVCDLGSTNQGKDWAAKLEVYGFVIASQEPSIDYGGKNRRMVSVYEITEIGKIALRLLNVYAGEARMVTVPVKINEERLKFFQCHRW